MLTLSTLKGLFDALEEGVLFLDAHRHVVEMNQAAAQLLGAEAMAAVPMLCPSVFAGTECAHHCEASGICSLTPGNDEPRKVQDILLRRADGGERNLRMWALMLPPNSQQVYCAIVLRDRTHETALENQVRERWRLGGLVGRHATMRLLYAEILRCAASEANVLITGESGVGKELVARAIHDNSPRSAGPFVPLHCAALPENLLESELFGHAKGAFSGATAARIGRFEAAEGGTLLLDEAGELSPAMQTKLLRVLQEREIVRLGENRARKIDVRVIAATHRNLAAMVASGEFREDLYYRLRVLPVQVPALRERAEDLPMLAAKLLDDLRQQYKRPGLQLASSALALLERHPWPGNVRQLANALEFAVVHADGTRIYPEHFPPEIQLQSLSARPAQTEAQAPIDETEDDKIARILAEAGGNRAEAARRLHMSRTTLWKRLKELKLDAPPGSADCDPAAGL